MHKKSKSFIYWILKEEYNILPEFITRMEYFDKKDSYVLKVWYNKYKDYVELDNIYINNYMGKRVAMTCKLLIPDNPVSSLSDITDMIENIWISAS